MFLRLSRVALLAAVGLGIAAPAVSATKPAQKPAASSASRAASYAAMAKLPDWDQGVWQIDWAALFGAGGRPEPPSLTPKYASGLKEFMASQKQGENVQNDNANCVPPGMPQIMQMPYPLEFIYSPGRVTIAIETDSQVRRIYTDGRKHPDDPDPTFNGDSIGHWEGQDLVVDTVGLDPHIRMAPGVGHGDKVDIQERFHQTGPDKLAVTTTITDPEVLTKPWSVTRPYIRHRDWQIEEYVCEQNNHDSADDKGRAGFDLKDDYGASSANPPSH